MNKRELIRLHKRLCKELGIPPCEVRFLHGKAVRGPMATYLIADKQIVLFGKRIKARGYCPKRIIAHETMHHKQNMKGWLDPRTGYYRGKDTEKLPWSQRAEERAANRYERKIALREGW